MKNALRTAVALLLCLALVSAVPVGAAEPTVSVTVEGNVYYDMAYEVLELVNAERTARGLKPLVMNVYLLEAATQRAGEIALHFSHTRPDGSDWYTAHNRRFHSSGENIAAGHTSAAEVVAGWMGSEGHRKNILSTRYESIGVGVFSDGGRLHWTQMFAVGGTGDVVQKRGTVQTEITITAKKEWVTVRSPFGDYGTCVCHRFTPLLTANGVTLSPSCLSVSIADPSVATVQDGYVQPKKAGKTTVTVALKGSDYTFTLPLTVYESGCGDVDQSGKVDSTDARMVLQYAVGKVDTLPAAYRGDVNADYRIDSTDARLILQYAIGKIPAFTHDMKDLL